MFIRSAFLATLLALVLCGPARADYIPKSGDIYGEFAWTEFAEMEKLKNCLKKRDISFIEIINHSGHSIVVDGIALMRSDSEGTQGVLAVSAIACFVAFNK
jgi:hypothetical protein